MNAPLTIDTVTGKTRAISVGLLTVAAHLEGLANNGFGWTKPECEKERQGHRAALRTNAQELRDLARLLGE